MNLQQFSPLVGEKAERLSYSLFFEPHVPSIPKRPFGTVYEIWGVGVIDVKGKEAVATFVDAIRTRLAEGTRLPILEAEKARKALQAVFGADLQSFSDIVLLGIRVENKEDSIGNT